MGWSSGTGVAEGLINSIEQHVDDSETRFKLYKDMIETLTDYDWDNLDECEGISDEYDKAVKHYYKRRR